MKNFIFDLQRFALTFEFTNGTKTFEDRGNIGGDGKHYDIYQYYPTDEWNEYLQYQNYKLNKLTAINEYRCFPEAISNGWQDWQLTVPGASFPGDYRILRGGNKEYHALENHQASYVKMYGRNDGAVLNNDGGNNALMVGGTGNDYITNSGNFVEINAGAGGDYISNSAGNHVTIDAGNDEGSDTVENSGSSVQIVTGAGMDRINNSGSDADIDAGVGNDTIENKNGNNSILKAGAGDDEIFNSGTNVKILAGNNNDRIENKGTKVTIDAGADAGRDTVENSGSSVQIIAGSGADFIKNSGSNVNIDAGADESSDTVENSGGNVEIVTGAGMDKITNSGSGVRIYAGVGNDEIQSDGGSNVTLDGGAGDDVINNSSTNAKILAGNNNDRIYNRANNVNIDAGTGNDEIRSDGGSDVVIDGGAGDDEIFNSSTNSKILAGNNNDKIENHGDKVTIDAGTDEGCDTVENSGGNVEITTGAGMDQIANSGSKVTIDAGVGNDIVNNTGEDVSIDAGKGDDLITNTAENVRISAGANDDQISNQASNVTIDADAGTDYVKNDAANVTINATYDEDEIDGDTSEDFFADAVLINASGYFDSITVEGGSVTVDNSENKLYVDSPGQKLMIKAGAADDRIINKDENVFINAGSGDDHVGNSARYVTIRALVGNDSVYNTGDNVSIDALDSSDGDKNLIYNEGSSVTITAGAGSESIVNNQGKNVTIDAGDGTNEVSIFGGENISVATGGGENYIIAYGNYTDGLGQAPLVAYGNYSGHYLTIDAGKGRNFISVGSGWEYVTINGGDDPAGIDAVLNDSDNAFISVNAGIDLVKNTGDFVNIFGGEDGDVLTNHGNNAYIQGDNGKGERRSEDYIYTDFGEDVTIDGGKDNDIIEAYHDVRASISGGAGNDNIFLNRITAKDLKSLFAESGQFAKDIVNIFLSVKGVPLTISDQKQDWLAAVTSSEYVSPLSGGSQKAIGFASIVLTGIQAWQDVSKLLNHIGELFGSESTVNGGTGDDTIVSDGYAPRIFEYSQGDGNDVYYNFNENKTDKDSGLSTLDIKSGRIGHIAVIGNDVTFVVGTGSVKLVDGANKKFKLAEDEEGGSIFTRAYGINYDTNEVICSIFGSAADEDIQDNVGIKRDKTTYIGVNVERKDTIIGETFANVIYGNGGNDNLRGNDKDDTIYGGNGNDVLVGNGGNDVLYGYGGTDEIYGGAGNDTIYSNEGDTVDGGKGDDYIRNIGDNASISAGGDNDTVEHYGDKATIETGAGNDKIVSYGKNVSISTGDDNDTIEVHRYNVTVEAGTGNDSIQVGDITGNDSADTFNIKVNAGADNDTVESYVSNVTIAGNVGDDLIILSAGADRNFIDYKDGDGHDEIRGLTNDDTLKISSGKVSKATVEGSDVILTVGEGSLRFKNFSNKEFKFTAADGEIFKCKLFADSVTKEMAGSIVGGKGQTTLYGTSYSDRFYGSDEIDVIYGNDGNDNLYGEGGNDYIDGGWGNDFIYATSGNNTLIGGADNDNIIVGGSKNLIIHNYGDGSDTVGGLGGGTIRILGAGYTTLRASDKEGSIEYYDMIIEVGDYSDTAGQTVIKPISRIYVIENADGKNFKIEGDFAGELAPEGTYLDGNTLRLKENYSDNIFDANNISLPIKSIDASLLNKGITVFGNGSIDLFTGSKFGDVYYCDMNSADLPAKTFLMAEDSAEVSPATIKAGGGNDTIYGGERKNLYVYNAGDGDDVIYNVGASDALSVLGGTYARSINDNDLIVKVGSGSVTFKNAATQMLNILGDENSAPAWKLNGTTATYGNLITVTGVKSLDGVSLNNKTVTISNAALNQGTVTISDGYTLTLADDVAKVSTTVAKWTGSGSTFTYTAAGLTAGYKLSGNKISYIASSGGDKFTLTGLKNTSAVTVSGKKVTISKDSLNGKAVELTGDFTLALGKDVTTSAKKTSGAFSAVSKGTATYKTTATSDFYKVSGKTISYTAGTGGQSITIKNLNTAATLATVKKGITVAEQSNGTCKITFKNSAVLTTKAPTISVAKGLKYTVTVADSLEPVTKSAWNVSGTTATFRATTTAGYTVNSKNAVVYSAQKNGSALLELTGLAKNVKASSIAAPKGKVVTLKADVLGAKTSVKSNGGGYTINLTGNMSGKKFTGTGKVDTLTVAANNASIDLGAGNDVVTVSGLKVTLSGGAGNDVLTGGKNVDLLYGGAGNDSILGNAGNDKIFGDAGNDTLRGGAGADTLTGGKGNDSLWGDAGKDTFLYSSGDGKDIIFGFENNDLLQITGTFSASYNKSKKEIAFKVGSTANAITLKDFTATSFHVNGDIYGISGNKFIKK